MRHIYIQPTLRIEPVESIEMLALSGTSEGIGDGGNASSGGGTPPEPDVKGQADSDIWGGEW